jgi:hypothetical protein
VHFTNDGFFDNDNKVNYRVPSKDKQLVIAALGFLEGWLFLLLAVGSNI